MYTSESNTAENCIKVQAKNVTKVWVVCYLMIYYSSLNCINYFIQGYPNEGKVSTYLMQQDPITRLLCRYNPMETLYNEEQQPIFNALAAPVLFDPFEQCGFMLRACAALGYKYCCVCPTSKIANFINKNWLAHLLGYFKNNTYMVSVDVISFLITILQVEQFIVTMLTPQNATAALAGSVVDSFEKMITIDDNDSENSNNLSENEQSGSPAVDSISDDEQDESSNKPDVKEKSKTDDFDVLKQIDKQKSM